MPSDDFFDLTRRNWIALMPTTDPGAGRPWRDPESGAVIAGGAVIATKAYVDAAITDTRLVIEAIGNDAMSSDYANWAFSAATGLVQPVAGELSLSAGSYLMTVFTIIPIGPTATIDFLSPSIRFDGDHTADFGAVFKPTIQIKSDTDSLLSNDLQRRSFLPPGLFVLDGFNNSFFSTTENETAVSSDTNGRILVNFSLPEPSKVSFAIFNDGGATLPDLNLADCHFRVFGPQQST